jgi:hypothetical protein
LAIAKYLKKLLYIIFFYKRFFNIGIFAEKHKNDVRIEIQRISKDTIAFVNIKLIWT